MKLILKASVPHLGEPGDIVDVKRGFARNYLLPKGFAAPATDASLRAIEHELTKFKAAAEELRAEARKLAAKLAGERLTFERKVVDADEGNLYGSVTVADIGDGLDALGYEIDRGEIHLEHPIKNTGEHEVVITLAHGVDGKVAVTVLPEGGPVEAPPAEVAADPEIVEDAAMAGTEEEG